MSFGPGSRYARVARATMKLPDGREVAYLRRRFLPQGSAMPLLGEATVAPGERLDQLANRTLGDPEASGRVCDANDAMDPADLTREPGRLLRVPIPEA